MNPRHILVSVSGMSPAVITETLYALLVQEEPAIVPAEIHVITTQQGKQRILQDLLDPEQGAFHSFMRDYLPGRSIRFDADTVHVIGELRQQKASPFGQLTGMPGQVFHELDDITTAEDNEAAANTIYRVLRELKSQPGTRLHASVAGGRKSMSFYMGHAFSLLADAEDQLSHVLVNEPFENPQLGFYYPPRQPRLLCWTDRQAQQQQGKPLPAGEGAADGHGLGRATLRRRPGGGGQTLGLQTGVVKPTARRIPQGEIGLLQLPERLLGLRLRQIGGVGVVALAEAAEGLAQGLGTGIRPDLKQLVVAGLIGDGHRRCAWSAGS